MTFMRKSGIIVKSRTKSVIYFTNIWRNMTKKKISESTISRLFIYLRELTELAELKIRTISSAELGERANISDVHIRKDLGHFGNFGVSGAGYSVEELKKALEVILGKDKVWNVAIAGVGHLGSALLAYTRFSQHGLNISAAFDVDIRKIGKQLEGITVQSIEEIPQTARDKNILMGVITVPAAEARGVADVMVRSGIECILNFAPVSLSVPKHVKVRDVYLSRELEMLSYFLANKNGNGTE